MPGQLLSRRDVFSNSTISSSIRLTVPCVRRNLLDGVQSASGIHTSLLKDLITARQVGQKNLKSAQESTALCEGHALRSHLLDDLRNVLTNRVIRNIHVWNVSHFGLQKRLTILQDRYSKESEYARHRTRE